MKRARIASLPATIDLLPGERRAIVEWPSTPDGNPVAGCVVSATRASDGTPMLDVMDCDPAMRVRVVWANLAPMSIDDEACDRALAVLDGGIDPRELDARDGEIRRARRATMRAAILAAITGAPPARDAASCDEGAIDALRRILDLLDGKKDVGL